MAIRDTEYANAVARIRVREAKMADRARMNRMTDAETAEEAFKLLLDTGFAEGLEAPSVDRYEDALAYETDATLSFLRQISPEDSFLALFLSGLDIHNLKVLIKDTFTGENHEALLRKNGSVPLEALQNAVLQNDFGALPKVLHEAALEAIESYHRYRDARRVDMILDRAHYAQLSELAEEMESPLVRDFVRAKIDFINLRTLLRLSRQKNPEALLEAAVLPGGSLGFSFFETALSGSLSEAVSSTRYAEALSEGVQSFVNSGKLTLFEKLSDNYLMRLVRKAKYQAFGVEPLVAYYYAKETEIKAARIILVGKINGISPEGIRERLREIYD